MARRGLVWGHCYIGRDVLAGTLECGSGKLRCSSFIATTAKMALTTSMISRFLHSF
jgi:hypothetical protein